MKRSRNNFWKRMVLFLLAAVILGVLPLAPEDVEAAGGKVTLAWDLTWDHKVIQIEQGERFQIGHYAVAYVGQDTMRVSQVKASYTSSKGDVAAVESRKGYVTTKGIGKTTITIRCKGKKLSRDIQVVAQGTFGESKGRTMFRELAAKMDKKFVKEINSKNGFAFSRLMSEYRKINEVYPTFSMEGFTRLRQQVDWAAGGIFYQPTNKLAVPQAGSCVAMNQILMNYASKHNPSWKSGDMLKFKSASATTKGIKVRLKKKVSAAQILAAKNGSSSWFGKQASGNNKAYTRVYLFDLQKSGNNMTLARAELVKGSSIVKIIPYRVKGNQEVKGKLTKGHTYKMSTDASGEESFWTQGKTVTVK